MKGLPLSHIQSHSIFHNSLNIKQNITNEVIPVKQNGLYSVCSYFAEKNVQKQRTRGNMNITVSLSNFTTLWEFAESKEVIQ